VRGGRATVEDDAWGNVVAVVGLSDAFGSDALANLDESSHAEIIFVFDGVPDAKIERGARRPQGRTDWRLVGIFAQRGKNRPNRIGSTIAEILAVEGRNVRVRGLDAVDGTRCLISSQS
jgi:tRNA (Thr-GGU) A37 N-methylase